MFSFINVKRQGRDNLLQAGARTRQSKTSLNRLKKNRIGADKGGEAKQGDVGQLGGARGHKRGVHCSFGLVMVVLDKTHG